jgi:uncharacterized SAM-binding protein YcdF (DUF218 family)
MPKNRSCFHYLAKYFLIFCFSFLILLVVSYLFRAPLLTAFTNLWVIDHGRVPANAVVVFGGGSNTRPLAAAQAYNDGLVPMVIVPDINLEPMEESGMKKAETLLNRDIVLSAGVPESAVQFYGDKVTSTWEEALAIKAWCEANQATTILCPTGFPFTRRLSWILGQVLKDTGITAHVYPIESWQYNRANWWTDEWGFTEVQNEVLKYLVYHYRY